MSTDFQNRPILNPINLPAIKLQTRSGVTLLDTPALSFEPGKVYLLVGPSGSGKSLFLRSLFGWAAPEQQAFLSPTKGQFFMLQDPGSGLTPRLTIAQHFKELGLTSKDRPKLISICAELGLSLPDLEHRVPKNLSGGERQRFMLAMILIQNPAWLVCDEPGASLDSETQQAMWRMLKTFTQQGLTLLLATHRWHQLPFKAHQVLNFYQGQLTKSQPKKSQTLPQVALPKSTSPAGENLCLEAERLVVSYQADPILTLDHFQLSTGTTIWLSGESGSGKTSLANFLAGIGKSHSGSLLLNGKPLKKNFQERTSAEKKLIYPLFQHGTSSLNPNRSVIVQLKEAYQKSSLPLSNMLESLELQNLDLSATPDHYSVGERQRLNLLRCLGLKPNFILADELLSPLDHSNQIRVLKLLKYCQQQWPLGILVIGHDLSQKHFLPGKHLHIDSNQCSLHD